MDCFFVAPARHSLLIVLSITAHLRALVHPLIILTLEGHTVTTTLLDHTVLHIPEADELRELALVDRLSLKFGLWLLQRAQRPKPEPAGSLFLSDRHLTASEARSLLEFHLQRQLR